MIFPKFNDKSTSPPEWTTDQKNGIVEILITLENSVFEIVFVVNYVLHVPLVPKAPSCSENKILK
jgi:hypothetical protein